MNVNSVNLLGSPREVTGVTCVEKQSIHLMVILVLLLHPNLLTYLLKKDMAAKIGVVSLVMLKVST